MKSVLQTITIAGQPCAIVPLAEYHALREALEDAADNATLVRLRAGNAGEEARRRRCGMSSRDAAGGCGQRTVARISRIRAMTAA